MSKLHVDFERYNLYRRPDWRYERVLTMAQRLGSPGRCTSRDDEPVKVMRNFKLRYDHAGDYERRRMSYENPGLHMAYMVYQDRLENTDASRKGTLIEARILARQEDEEIAREIGTGPETIDWYEKIFFNVRDRLDAKDWILDEVLLPAFEAHRNKAVATGLPNTGPSAHSAPVPIAEPFFDATLKFFAYFGLKNVLDYMLSGFRTGMAARSGEEVGEYLNQHFMQGFKRRSASAVGTFDVNRYNVMQLFEVHSQIIAIEQSAGDDAQKHDQTTKAVRGMMSEFKWAVGKDDGNELVAGTAMAQIDDNAAEPRDDETLMLMAGYNPAGMDEWKQLEMPTPCLQPVGGNSPEAPHADAK